MKTGTVLEFYTGFKYEAWKYFYVVSAEVLGKAELVQHTDSTFRKNEKEGESTIVLDGMLVLGHEDGPDQIIKTVISPEILFLYGVRVLDDVETAVKLLEYGGFHELQ